MKRTTCLSLLILAGALPRLAAAANLDCFGVELDPVADAASYRVVAKAGTHVLLTAGDKKGCPAIGGACDKLALAAAETVFGWHAKDGWICASHRARDGVTTTGWIAASDLRAIPARGPTPRAAWGGHWVRDDDAHIDIVAAPDRLVVSGTAQWGDGPGNFNFGSIESTDIAWTAEKLRFVAGAANARFVVDDLDETDPEADYDRRHATCRVVMQRLGDYLAVESSPGCGGFNVSFGGVYARAQR